MALALISSSSSSSCWTEGGQAAGLDEGEEASSVCGRTPPGSSGGPPPPESVKIWLTLSSMSLWMSRLASARWAPAEASGFACSAAPCSADGSSLFPSMSLSALMLRTSLSSPEMPVSGSRRTFQMQQNRLQADCGCVSYLVWTWSPHFCPALKKQE